MLIRRANPDDADAIADLRDRSIRAQGPSGYRPDQVDAWAGHFDADRAQRLIEEFETWVAEEEGRILGFGAYTPATGDDVSLYTDPDAFGRGVGRALTDRLAASARAAGQTHLCLRASLNALGFYRRLGFVDEEPIEHEGPTGVVFTCVNMRLPL